MLYYNNDIATTTPDFKEARDADNNAVDLAASAKIISRHHREAECATATALDPALAAGDELIKVKKSKKIRHGEWGWFYKKCGLSDRTARRYKQLAENRSTIEVKRSRTTGFSIADALREVGNKKSNRQKPELSARPFKMASPKGRTEWMEQVGMQSFLEAWPQSWWDELNRRVDRQRSIKKLDVFDETITKDMQQALSLQKGATDKNNMSAAANATMNRIVNRLEAAGLGPNDVDLVVRSRPSVKHAA
jgi:hypothetical protein